MAVIAATSCAELALYQGAKNKMSLDDVQERTGINVWTEAEIVASKTRFIYEIGADQRPKPVAIVAPAYSHHGVAVRLAAPIIGKRLYATELQVGILTESGIESQCTLDGGRVERIGDFTGGWMRLPLDQAMLQRAETEGMDFRVECEVGAWTFNMYPAYFEGFKSKWNELRSIAPPLSVVNESMPPER